VAKVRKAVLLTIFLDFSDNECLFAEGSFRFDSFFELALSVLEVITSLAGSAPFGGHSRSRCLEGNEAKSQQSDARF
jgi:hypothetical protein